MTETTIEYRTMNSFKRVSLEPLNLRQEIRDQETEENINSYQW